MEEEVEDGSMEVYSRTIWFTSCSGCGEESLERESPDEARRVARKDLWAVVKGKTLCGDCRGIKV